LRRWIIRRKAAVYKVIRNPGEIIITGGGAILLGEILISELGQQAYVIGDPVFANVSGYLKFAQRIWKP